MQAGEDYDVRAVDLEENCVGEAAEQDTTDFFDNSLVVERVASKDCGGCAERAEELVAQPSTLGFVPAGRIRDFLPGLRPGYEPIYSWAHSRERSIRSSTSSRGVAAPGFCR